MIRTPTWYIAWGRLFDSQEARLTGHAHDHDRYELGSSEIPYRVTATCVEAGRQATAREIKLLSAEFILSVIIDWFILHGNLDLELLLSSQFDEKFL